MKKYRNILKITALNEMVKRATTVKIERKIEVAISSKGICETAGS